MLAPQKLQPARARAAPGQSTSSPQALVLESGGTANSGRAEVEKGEAEDAAASAEEAAAVEGGRQGQPGRRQFRGPRMCPRRLPRTSCRSPPRSHFAHTVLSRSHFRTMAAAPIPRNRPWLRRSGGSRRSSGCSPDRRQQRAGRIAESVARGKRYWFGRLSHRSSVAELAVAKEAEAAVVMALEVETDAAGAAAQFLGGALRRK